MFGVDDTDGKSKTNIPGSADGGYDMLVQPRKHKLCSHLGLKSSDDSNGASDVNIYGDDVRKTSRIKKWSPGPRYVSAIVSSEMHSRLHMLYVMSWNHTGILT